MEVTYADRWCCSFFQLPGTGSMPQLYCCTRRTWDWQQRFQARAQVERGKTKQLTKQCADRALQRAGEPVLHPTLLKMNHNHTLPASPPQAHQYIPSRRRGAKRQARMNGSHSSSSSSTLSSFSVARCAVR